MPVNKLKIAKNPAIAAGNGGQVIRGRVTAVKSLQTAVVLVERTKTHPLYGKSFKRSKKYLVHDLLNVAVGDVVEIGQIRPLSKNKHFQVLRKVGKDIVAVASEQLKEEAAEAIAEVMPEEKEEEPTEVVVETAEKIEEKKLAKKEKKAKE